MSQLDSETKEIGGHQFTVFKLPPLTAQDVLIDIGQVVAPALGKAASVLGSESGENPLDMDVDDPRIATGLAALSQSITKKRMRDLVETMAEVTVCDGTPLPKTMEMTFRGDLPLMYQWLWFALQVQFGNFTGWLGSAIKGVSVTVAGARSQRT